MSVDLATVQKVAGLARIRLDANDAEAVLPPLNSILAFVEQLDEVDVSGVVPMTSAMTEEAVMRSDRVTDGGYSDKVLANAPTSEEGFFLVPKVLEQGN